MSERVAIVVGAGGGGLGRATAEKLAAAGFTVAGVDRSEQELPDGIRREAADPADPATARSVVDWIAAEVGPPELLVNTIGAYHLGEALTATGRRPAAHDRRRCGRGAVANPGGGLVPAGTRFGFGRARGRHPGLESAAGMAAYAVSKAALVHLTRVLDLELRPFGIRVNAVAPQLIDTAKNRPYLTPELLAHAVAPEAVADIIVYLVSDAAAPVSGAIVPAYGA